MGDLDEALGFELVQPWELWPTGNEAVDARSLPFPLSVTLTWGEKKREKETQVQCRDEVRDNGP